MMIENNYSINVAKMETKADHVPRYYHYCKIEEICTLFPRWEFGLTLDYIECSSKTIEERS